MKKKPTEITKELQELEEKVVEVKRTSKKTEGGNRLSFSALVVVGDKSGKVGAAVGKARQVVSAIRKASQKARKQMVEIPLVGEAKTISHELDIKMKAVHIMLKPAPLGTGVVAGGSVRVVLITLGVQNIVSKMLGSKNKKGNVYAVIEGLKKLKDSKQRIVG